MTDIEFSVGLKLPDIFKAYCLNLVGGLENFLFFHSVGNFIIPTDELHHSSEG
jgi:hypothetical protein